MLKSHQIVLRFVAVVLVLKDQSTLLMIEEPIARLSFID